MSIEENKALVQRLGDVLNAGDWVTLDDILAPEFAYINPAVATIRTRDNFKQLMIAMRAAFPPGEWTVGNLVAEADRVACELTFRGVHRAPYRGVAPTGNDVTMENLVIARVAGGKVVEARALSDSLGLLVRIGAVPGPSQPTR